MKLRKATINDAAAMIAIKEQLPLTLSDDTTSRGGFLLAADEATYIAYIRTSWCAVAEHDGRVVGFGIMLPDDVLRASDIWLRRHSATWHIHLPAYETQQLCYFEQFAFLNGYRRTAIALAYQLTQQAYSSGCTAMFTTTVHKPVLNLAAVPFIYASGGIKAGQIDETYPIVGPILSDIYVMHADTFRERLAAHPLLSFFRSTPSIA